ncbi:MAG: flavodoxin family protein [Deltaproteobacteria bacterium]|nr:flavodoxin family protein [Candidatus Anaeroferrophillus wilburensis]MBN2888665.1 flavodoxin family protein [Deltaproteobacteria bacterium]
MKKIGVLYGSPRRQGNTARLTGQAVRGARDSGAEVVEFVLRDLKISPCLEIYGCRQNGRCVIKDDFQTVVDELESCQGIILSSPIFFYAVSGHTKAFMDRFQSRWVKKYWLDKVPFNQPGNWKKGLFIAAGATRGRQLFTGAALTVRYFFDALDTELWRSLLYRGLDGADDVLSYPEYLEEAYQSGKDLVLSLQEGQA